MNPNSSHVQVQQTSTHTHLQPVQYHPRNTLEVIYSVFPTSPTPSLSVSNYNLHRLHRSFHKQLKLHLQTDLL